jgi:hypothetical protein
MQQLNEAWEAVDRNLTAEAQPSDAGVAVPNMTTDQASIWPALPSQQSVLRKIQAALAAERFVTTASVSSVSGITDASISIWRLRTLIETRQEAWETHPGAFAPPPADCYDGDLDEVQMPVPDGEAAFTLYRADTIGREVCPDCQAGQRRCTRCFGTGHISCPTTEKCPVCSGSGTVLPRDAVSSQDFTPQPCIQCSGSGRAVCGRCRGSGYKPCWECAGRGQIPCTTCAATGTLTRVLVGSVERRWNSESQPGYAESTVAAQANRQAPSAPGEVVHKLPGNQVPAHLPPSVTAAATPLLRPRPGELLRELKLAVTPAVRVEADGADGKQTVWLVGEPPVVVAPSSEMHRMQRRRQWRIQLAKRLAPAVAAAAITFVALLLSVSLIVALPVAVVVAAVLGALLSRSLIVAARQSNGSTARPAPQP